MTYNAPARARSPSRASTRRRERSCARRYFPPMGVPRRSDYTNRTGRPCGTSKGEREMRKMLLCAACLGLAALPALADDYPQWRGPNRDGISKEAGLLPQWPRGGPKLLWTARDLGGGYSTPSVARGRIYLM